MNEWVSFLAHLLRCSEEEFRLDFRTQTVKSCEIKTKNDIKWQLQETLLI